MLQTYCTDKQVQLSRRRSRGLRNSSSFFNCPFQAKSSFIIESFLFHDGFCLMVLCLATGETKEEMEKHTHTKAHSLCRLRDVIVTFR